MAPIMLRVPETARPLLHRAAALIRDGSDPAEALRVAGGSNEEPLPDREALERLIEQITQERDHYRSQHDRITDAMIETQQQNSVLRTAFCFDLWSQPEMKSRRYGASNNRVLMQVKAW